MKKIMIRFLPLILIVVIMFSSLVFYGVTLAKDNGLGITETDLSNTAVISGTKGCKSAFDKSKMTSWSINHKGSEAIIDFQNMTNLNALVLNEIGHNVKKFSVYYDNNQGEWILCYRQCEIGINRLATFYTIETKRVKVVIDDFKTGVLISDIGVYNLAQREREQELRITSYITPPSITKNMIDPNCFDVVTDVQFIAYGRFQKDGSISERADQELDTLKNMIGERDVNILITIFPPLSPDYIADVFRNNMDKAVESVVERVLATGTGGADFDWEYPANAEEYDLYSQFLIKLKNELKKYDKQVSVALSPWGVQLSKDAINAIDQLQIMAYDLFDHNGDNNSYSGSVENSVLYMLNQGFRAEQLNLGISYYGRPSDGRGKWYYYNDERFTPDEYIMFQNNVWFNTPTTVRDKTVYAILKGLGGIMTFAQDEDVPMSNPLSLTAQIGKAKNEFSKEVA